jgi:glycosyltransferase involved in cell wall biosynthesis
LKNPQRNSDITGLTIAWVLPVVPYPPKDGGTIRVYHLLKGLANKHRVHLFAMTATMPAPGDLRKLEDMCASVHLFPMPGRSRRGSIAWWRARWNSHLGPAHVYYDRQLHERIDQLCRQEHVDLVLLETLKTAGYRSWVTPTNGDQPWSNVILCRQNYEPDISRRMAEVATGAKDRAAWRMSAWRLGRAERRVGRHFRFMTAVSEKDAESLRRVAPSAEVAVVPNGADPALFAPTRDRSSDPTVVITGTMEYAPNRDSAEFFCRAIWPLVRAECPSAMLRIVGNAATRHVPELIEVPGVEIRQPADDIAAELSGEILVVPLRVGSGTRVKILEALAAGKAVVSTTIGCEGLDLIAGEHLLVCDEAAGFAKAVVSLLSDPQLRQRLGANGRRVVEERYTWANAVGCLETFCEHVAGQVRQETEVTQRKC